METRETPPEQALLKSPDPDNPAKESFLCMCATAKKNALNTETPTLSPLPTCTHYVLRPLSKKNHGRSQRRILVLKRIPGMPVHLSYGDDNRLQRHRHGVIHDAKKLLRGGETMIRPEQISQPRRNTPTEPFKLPRCAHFLKSTRRTHFSHKPKRNINCTTMADETPNRLNSNTRRMATHGGTIFSRPAKKRPHARQ